MQKPRSGLASAIAAAYIARARSAARQRNWQQAAAWYERALRLVPSRAGTWVQFGHMQKESRQTARAIDAYRRALMLRPSDAETHMHLGHLLAHGDSRALGEAHFAYAAALGAGGRILPVNLGPADAATGEPETRDVASVAGPAADFQGAFDVSDLVDYFRGNRLPTGIQRVQIEVISALLGSASESQTIGVVCFSERVGFWVEVPRGIFQRLVGLAALGGDLDDPAWKAARTALDTFLATATEHVFAVGSCLINIGTSWNIPNYFLMLREAILRSGIRYIPFVHDCIPIMTPEHCHSGLVAEFVAWIVSVFFHADTILVNSDATADDVVRVAERLGHRIARPTVIRLDGRFGLPQEAAPTVRSPEIGGRPYVLFVSTVESRKNHLHAFRSWIALAERRGMDRTPLLVCVGKLGWKYDEAVALREQSAVLRDRVVFLTDVSDRALSQLYEDCLFTIYPSFYEGWGLPITESLCHGKIPLTTRVSSMGEAGGEFAVYFAPGSVADTVAKIEDLLDDAAGRARREARIAGSFRSRSWSEIARQLMAEVEASRANPDPYQGSLAVIPGDGRRAFAFPARAGVFHSLAKNQDPSLWKGRTMGEMYRSGTDWRAADFEQCLARSGRAALAFRTEARDGDEIVVFVCLDGAAGGTRSWIRLFETVLPHQANVVGLSIGQPEYLTLLRTSGFRVGDGWSGGVVGFIYAFADDLKTRQLVTEAIVLNDLSGLRSC